jgi:hypothetical protein
VTVLDFGLRRPTLDDVFLTLTGRSVEPDEDSEPDDRPAAGAVGSDPDADAAAEPAGAGR